jgi:hypothetical protein
LDRIARIARDAEAGDESSAVTTIGFFVPASRLYLPAGTISTTSIQSPDRKSLLSVWKNQLDSRSNRLQAAETRFFMTLLGILGTSTPIFMTSIALDVATMAHLVGAIGFVGRSSWIFATWDEVVVKKKRFCAVQTLAIRPEKGRFARANRQSRRRAGA